NPDPGKLRITVVVGQKGRASFRERRGELDRVRGLDAGNGSKMCGGLEQSEVEVDELEPTAARQQGLIASRERFVPGSQGDDDGFQQGQGRCNPLDLAAVDRLEDRFHEGEVGRMLLDEIDEDRGIETERALPQVAQESQESRSARTWAFGSM